MKSWLKKLITLILVNLLKKPDYDNKISDMEGKIPSITYLATTTALTAVKNTILTVRCKAIIYILL